MFKKTLQILCCLVLWPLFVTGQVTAQIARQLYKGESSQFEIISVPGISYYWKTVEQHDLKEIRETYKVRYLSARNKPAILLKWEKSGTYFLFVTAINQGGCSNVKAYPVVVNEDHAPVANDDYLSTNWLRNLQIDVLRNDHDSNSDIDSSTLKILSEADYGKVRLLNNGRMTYIPLINHTGNDRFYYRICDKSNQCDSAMVSINLRAPDLFIPEAISPNGDGLNDQFIIEGLAAYPKSSLLILSRDGVVIYRNDDYQNDWAGVPDKGKFSGPRILTGTYYYIFTPGGTKRMIKGFVFVAG